MTEKRAVAHDAERKRISRMLDRRFMARHGINRKANRELKCLLDEDRQGLLLLNDRAAFTHEFERRLGY